jgi:hypothetical protein
LLIVLTVLTVVVLFGALLFLSNVLDDRAHREKPAAEAAWPPGRTNTSDLAAEAARLLIHANALDAEVVAQCKRGLIYTAQSTRREADRFRERARVVAKRIGVDLP